MLIWSQDTYLTSPPASRFFGIKIVVWNISPLMETFALCEPSFCSLVSCKHENSSYGGTPKCLLHVLALAGRNQYNFWFILLLPTFWRHFEPSWRGLRPRDAASSPLIYTIHYSDSLRWDQLCGMNKLAFIGHSAAEALQKDIHQNSKP